MADINIERREGAPWWLWALGLVIIGLIVFWLASAMGGEERVAMDDPAAYPVETALVTPMEPAEPAVSPAVQSFIERCAPAQPRQMGLDHQYTSGCIHDLVAALEQTTQGTATSTPAIEEAMTAARESADRLSESAAAETQHTSMTQNAFDSIVTVFERLQAERYPTLESHVGQLSQTAGSIDAGQPLLDQRDAVQSFFSQASDALAIVGYTAAPSGV
ncbi:MAG TPA: hypothetical protein VMN39_11795 [Longimicrobiaceae bacterium]|nr:hypothetical protein [Longimicrobiaceae bacterium]